MNVTNVTNYLYSTYEFYVYGATTPTPNATLSSEITKFDVEENDRIFDLAKINLKYLGTFKEGEKPLIEGQLLIKETRSEIVSWLFRKTGAFNSNFVLHQFQSFNERKNAIVQGGYGALTNNPKVHELEDIFSISKKAFPGLNNLIKTYRAPGQKTKTADELQEIYSMYHSKLCSPS